MSLTDRFDQQEERQLDKTKMAEVSAAGPNEP